MITDWEIWACANLLLKRHGRLARVRAVERADQLLAEGKPDGHRTFMRIADRIDELANATPPGQVH